MKTTEPSLEAVRDKEKIMSRRSEYRLAQFSIFQSPIFPWDDWQRIETEPEVSTCQQ